MFDLNSNGDLKEYSNEDSNGDLKEYSNEDSNGDLKEYSNEDSNEDLNESSNEDSNGYLNDDLKCYICGMSDDIRTLRLVCKTFKTVSSPIFDKMKKSGGTPRELRTNCKDILLYMVTCLDYEYSSTFPTMTTCKYSNPVNDSKRIRRCELLNEFRDYLGTLEGLGIGNAFYASNVAHLKLLVDLGYTRNTSHVILVAIEPSLDELDDHEISCGPLHCHTMYRNACVAHKRSIYMVLSVNDLKVHILYPRQDAITYLWHPVVKFAMNSIFWI